ncbi:hypothetical protein HPB52_002709 [Rhipicephalus sanguineus]|uniref:Uncharacterized protein n=1 Tax=Rhipicephalus sanguineus TaxID=34632 RepID=A0A9D4PHM2_RHISA|nr:hypothetical protein HPB52_002709 [Rhipicephalus sanguineus]
MRGEFPIKLLLEPSSTVVLWPLVSPKEVKASSIQKALHHPSIVLPKPYNISGNSCQSLILRILKLIEFPVPRGLRTCEKEMARLLEDTLVVSFVSTLAASAWVAGLL